mgnify:FL=1
MGNGKFLQFLTLLLCLCFGYFTYKAYSDVQQVKEENAILHEALDSLLVGSTMTTSAAEPNTISAASSISAFMDEIITDAHKEYRAGKKANAKEPLRIQVKSSYRMEDRYVRNHVEDPDVRGNAEGIVKLDIAIDKLGHVKSAKLNSASTITDEEVIEACKKAALKTDFNYNSDAPRLQRGTVTYTFYR